MEVVEAFLPPDRRLRSASRRRRLLEPLPSRNEDHEEIPITVARHAINNRKKTMEIYL
jgi:hypothetical protein